jgi:hypothetical protein
MDYKVEDKMLYVEHWRSHLTLEGTKVARFLAISHHFAAASKFFVTVSVLVNAGGVLIRFCSCRGSATYHWCERYTQRGREL